jgi:hypothetical protein
MAAMWIKQQSNGRTKVVLVGRPRRMLNDFDLILATPQYRLPQQSNVLRLGLPLMRVDAEKIEAGASAWRERLRRCRGVKTRLRALKRPTISL